MFLFYAFMWIPQVVISSPGLLITCWSVSLMIERVAGVFYVFMTIITWLFNVESLTDICSDHHIWLLTLFFLFPNTEVPMSLCFCCYAAWGVNLKRFTVENESKTWSPWLLTHNVCQTRIHNFIDYTFILFLFLFIYFCLLLFLFLFLFSQ